ncbi:MAG TPA: GDSL-type esterase/lipase family protein [Candidatus Binatia bacterium]
MRTRRLLLLLAEWLVLLVLLEAAVRAVVAPQVDVPHLRVHAEGFYTWYPGSRFTYHNLPGVVPASAPVRIDAFGLRGDEVPMPKPPGERRVLVVGDSYTAAVQLPEERIFTTLLQRALEQARPGATYRVLNAGVNGAGTAEELLYFEHEGATLTPDVVVLQYAFNDVDDTRRHGGFRLTADGVALRDDLRQPPAWRAPLLALRDALGNHSLAFYLLYRMLTGSHPPAAAAAEAPHAAPSPAELAPDVRHDVDLVVRLAGQLVRDANAIGAPVVLMTIPSPLYIQGGDPVYERVVAGFGALVAGTRNQLLVTDSILLAAHQRGESAILAGDGHLGEDGHRLVAEALSAAVLRALSTS